MAKWDIPNSVIAHKLCTCERCGENYNGLYQHFCPDACQTCGGAAGPSHVCPVVEGRKDDDGKARHDLLPPELSEGVAKVLAFGASKYGERNWEKGMKWGRPFAACMRHLWAWWRGEKADRETGMSHLWHAGCCIAFLIAYEARNIGVDDRP